MRISDWSSDVCSSDLTDVESTHRKLRARLTDGLGGNDTHGFAAVDQVAPAQIAAIAMRAQTMTRFAGQRRTYLDLVDADAIDELRSEEHTSELQSLMRISYAVFCLTKKQLEPHIPNTTYHLSR